MATLSKADYTCAQTQFKQGTETLFFPMHAHAHKQKSDRVLKIFIFPSRLRVCIYRINVLGSTYMIDIWKRMNAHTCHCSNMNRVNCSLRLITISSLFWSPWLKKPIHTLPARWRELHLSLLPHYLVDPNYVMQTTFIAT